MQVKNTVRRLVQGKLPVDGNRQMVGRFGNISIPRQANGGPFRSFDKTNPYSLTGQPLVKIKALFGIRLQSVTATTSLFHKSAATAPPYRTCPVGIKFWFQQTDFVVIKKLDHAPIWNSVYATMQAIGRNQEVKPCLMPPILSKLAYTTARML